MSEWSFITDGFAYYVLFAIIVSSLFVMALLGVNEKFNRWRIPLVALSFVVAIGATYVSLGELLSRPKPIDILTWDRPATDKAKVEGVYFIHGKAIFLLLMY